MAAATADGRVVAAPLARRTPPTLTPAAPPPHAARIVAACLADGAPWGATVDARGGVRVWECERGALVAAATLPGPPPTGAALSPDGRTLVVTSSDGVVGYAVTAGELVGGGGSGGASVRGARSPCFSPDGGALAVATATGVDLLDAGTMTLVATLAVAGGAGGGVGVGGPRGGGAAGRHTTRSPPSPWPGAPCSSPPLQTAACKPGMAPRGRPWGGRRWCRRGGGVVGVAPAGGGRRRGRRARGRAVHRGPGGGGGAASR